jgi:sugar/nucleoside kinase (ribokinase family)
MLTDPPSDALDLLVIGGLTIDRLADGSSAPGGSVMHVARAAAPRGMRVGVITAAGHEPEANAGLDELLRVCQSVDATRDQRTTTFRHRELAEGRRLWLERRGGRVDVGEAERDRIRAHAILFAPVAGEVTTDALGVWDETLDRGAILQGWLRTTDEGAEVEPVRLSTLPGPLREALARLDLIVASREDLRAEAPTPLEQLTHLRMAFGRAPVLVVTDSADGLWLDHPGVRPYLAWRDHLAVPRRVDGAPTVGAGDVLAAYLMTHIRNPPQGWRAHAESAMRIVAEVLEERKTA